MLRTRPYSVVGARAAGQYFEAVSALVRNHPSAARYLVDVSCAAAPPLTHAELEAIADTRTIVAGFRVPERSVRTAVVADGLVDALRVEPQISLELSTRVGAVTAEGSTGSSWRLETNRRVQGSFDFVVNALWEGRLAIDRSVGLAPESPWSNRYRVSLFVETVRPLDFPSVLVATGPFGDIKNYDGTHLPETVAVSEQKLKTLARDRQGNARASTPSEAACEVVILDLSAAMPVRKCLKWLTFYRSAARVPNLAGRQGFQGRGLRPFADSRGLLLNVAPSAR